MSKKEAEKEVLVMTPEILEALKGFSAVSDTFTFIYPIEGVPRELSPAFKIKALTVDETKELQELLSNSKKSDEERIAKLISLSKEKLVGWDNYYDQTTGGTLPFTGDGSDYDRLTPRLQVGIASEIRKVAGTF